MIELQNLSKFYYSDSSVTVALKKVNIKLPDKGLVAITGESGSGKTTLLNILSGQLPYDEGEMLFNGETTFQYDEADWEDYRKNNIGYIFQDYSLIMDYTVLDNILSVMVILDKNQAEANKKANMYLEKVGLSKFANRKARELSSGQKQRLSIARALSKETNIIVADEPTGNLDSETGEQIIKLLKEISEDNLVLLVTHNYQQAEPYVDRKIRIHDGEIVNDQEIISAKDKNLSGAKQVESEKVESEKVESEKVKTEQEKPDESDRLSNIKVDKNEPGKKFSVVPYFVRKNMSARKGKTAFYQLFFIVIAVVAFVFLGDFLTQLDEYGSKDYKENYFLNKNDKRLAVKKSDGSDFTSEDIEKLKGVKDVVSVDKYDYAQDINYYAIKDTDYEIDSYYVTVYNRVTLEDETTVMEPEEIEMSVPSFVDSSKFMRSESALSTDSICEGAMPNGLFEIVVSDDYNLKVGDTLCIYFTAKNMWGENEFYSNEFTVSGIASTDETQIYFSNDLSRMLGAKAKGLGVTLAYKFDGKNTKFEKSESFLLAINEKLDNTEIKYPEERKIGLSEKEVTFYGEVILSRDVLKRTQNTILKDDIEPTPFGELTYNGSVMYADIFEYENISSIHFLEVSRQMFDLLYEEDSRQATVYIDNYARTDKVIKRLDKLGYEAISTYRASCVEYNNQKVYDRFTRMGVAVAILVVLIFFEVLVIGFAMRMNRQDYRIMASIGMEKHNVKKVIYFELLIYSVASIVLVALLSSAGMFAFSRGILKTSTAFLGYISNLLYYFTWPSMIFYIAYCLLSQWLTSVVVYAMVKGGSR